MTDRKEPLDIEREECCRMIAAKLDETAWSAPSAGREIARFGAALRQEVRGVLPAVGRLLPTAPLRPTAPRRPRGVRHDDLLFIGALPDIGISGAHHLGCLQSANYPDQSEWRPQPTDVSAKKPPQEHEDVLQAGYGAQFRPREVQRRQQRQGEKRHIQADSRRPHGVGRPDSVISVAYSLGCHKSANHQEQSQCTPQPHEVKVEKAAQEHQEVLPAGYGVQRRPCVVVQRYRQRQAEKRNGFHKSIFLAEHEEILA